jgi:prolyl oligopeptidase
LIESIHGVEVPDPYRWLEAAGSGETRAWVEAQNALTRSHLDGPGRDDLVRRLRALYDYPRTLTFVARCGRLFFTHNPGLLDQPILYVQDGADAEPRVLLDPNTLSADGTTALTAYEVSPDGTRVAYALSEHGSDRQKIGVLGVAGARRLATVREVCQHRLTRDSTGFYPSLSGARRRAAGRRAVHGRIYFHRLGVRSRRTPWSRTPHARSCRWCRSRRKGPMVVITAQRRERRQ